MIIVTVSVSLVRGLTSNDRRVSHVLECSLSLSAIEVEGFTVELGGSLMTSHLHILARHYDRHTSRECDRFGDACVATLATTANALATVRWRCGPR